MATNKLETQPFAVQPPQQERSRASFERVLAAGAALLEEEGYDGFTLAGVSSRAKVSIGSIYARVKSKDDLFYVIQDRFMTESESMPGFATSPEGYAELPTKELIVQIVHDVGKTFQANSRLLRVFMHRGIVDAIVAERSSRSVSGFAHAFEGLLLTRRDEIVQEDPELAVDVAFRIAWGTLARQIMYWPTFESEHRIEWNRLVDELGTVLVAYLLDGQKAGASA
jgi:AcrR family transcriptional regulator